MFQHFKLRALKPRQILSYYSHVLNHYTQFLGRVLFPITKAVSSHSLAAERKVVPLQGAGSELDQGNTSQIILHGIQRQKQNLQFKVCFFFLQTVQM